MKRPRLLGKTGKSSGTSRINRAPSPLLAIGIPWVAVMIASILPSVTIVASGPVFPPLGFLLFIGWLQLRPGLLPIWAGLPLGLFDDLFSGQPFGGAALLWSIAAIAFEVVETRLPWRSFLTEWLVASGMIVVYILLGLAAANIAGAGTPIFVILPQIVISILVFPLVGRIVAVLDRIRLARFVEIG